MHITFVNVHKIVDLSCKLQINIVPTKVTSRGPAYSQSLNQNKIDRQGSRSGESRRQTVRQLWWMMVFADSVPG